MTDNNVRKLTPQWGFGSFLFTQKGLLKFLFPRGLQTMANKVDVWFDDLTHLHNLKLRQLRRLILAASENMSEEIKWGQPCYSINKLVCYLQKAKDHVTIGFQQGGNLDDPAGILEGDGKNMRHIKIPIASTIDENAIKQLIVNAVAYDAL